MNNPLLSLGITMLKPCSILFIFLASCSKKDNHADLKSESEDTSEEDSVENDSADIIETPLDGFGEIEGDCGLLLNSSMDDDPFIIQNSIDFANRTIDSTELSVGGQEILNDGNLNNGSLYSEIFAFELLYRCETATLLQTETEIEYTDPTGKKTDLLVSIQNQQYGISVTRAFNYPPEEPYTTEAAETLLADKLADISLSSANVPAGTWNRQILSIIAYSTDHASEIKSGWESMTNVEKGNTIIYVTATHGEDDFIY
jgi:hypothetical protein